MRSLTKRWLTDAQVAALVRAAFGPDVRVAACRELTGGMFSAAYALELDDGRETVLKVAPSPDAEVATHEVDMMRGEIEFYQLARAVPGVPVPDLLGYDTSGTLIDSDYLFLSRLRGTRLDVLRPELSDAEYAELRRELARIAARLQAVRGAAFGYLTGAAASRQPTWARSFLAMMRAIARDAERHEVRLPVPARRVVEAVERHADVLDDVEQPALVHADLWDANVFVRRDEGRPAIEGIIDGERAIHGDPCVELQSWCYLRELDGVADMLHAFGEERGVPLVLTDSLRLRHRLYSIYLHMIIATESVIRGYEESESAALLDRVLAALAADVGRL